MRQMSTPAKSLTSYDEHHETNRRSDNYQALLDYRLSFYCGAPQRQH